MNRVVRGSLHLAANTVQKAWKYRRFLKYSAAANLIRSGVNYYNPNSNNNNMPPIQQKRKRRHSAGKSRKRMRRGGLSQSTARKVMRVMKHKKKTRKEYNKSEVEPIHGEIERCYTKINLGRKPKSIRDGKWKYMDQFQGLYNGAAGQQAVISVSNILNVGNFLSDGSVTSTSLARGLFDINPNEYNSGSPLYSAGQIPADDRIMCEEVILKYEWCNFASTSIALDLYIFECIANTQYDPYTVWNAALAAQGLGQPVSHEVTVSGSVGSGTLVAGTQGYPTCNFIGQLPFTNPSFNKIWKKHSVVHFDLAPNASKFHEVKIIVNKMIDKQFLNQLSAGGNSFIKGLTHATMAIMRGQAVVDIHLASGKRVTTSQTEVGYVASREIHCSCAKQSVSRIQTAYAVPTLLAFENLNALQQVDVIDAVINPVLA